jgi:hypothetical protein
MPPVFPFEKVKQKKIRRKLRLSSRTQLATRNSRRPLRMWRNDKEEKEQNDTVGTEGRECDDDVQLEEIKGGEHNNEEEHDEMNI